MCKKAMHAVQKKERGGQERKDSQIYVTQLYCCSPFHTTTNSKLIRWRNVNGVCTKQTEICLKLNTIVISMKISIVFNM